MLPLLFLCLYLGSCLSNPFKANQEKEKKAPSQKPFSIGKPDPMVKKIQKRPQELQRFCSTLHSYFKTYQWTPPRCHRINWNFVRKSKNGYPLLWKTFGKEKKGNNVTLVLCGVHGDEITSVKLCFDLIDELIKNPLNMDGHTLAVAPLVTPDSFFKKRPTRTNANGVDVNRNFPTRDWNEKAIKAWKRRFRSDPRRNPGPYSLSEAETIFQVNLIKRYGPHKIISVHAPLTLIDYDGPRFPGKFDFSPGERLLRKMSKKALNYNIKNYPTFPGSLGNYAGNERDIPTYTLELPNTDPRQSGKFWKRFRDSLREAITTDFRNNN